MTEACSLVVETARKSLTFALQGLSEPGTQSAIAKAMQTSEATVSRLKTEHLQPIIEMLALSGMKVVKATDKTINEERLRAIAVLAHYALSSEEDFTNAILGDNK